MNVLYNLVSCNFLSAITDLCTSKNSTIWLSETTDQVLDFWSCYLVFITDKNQPRCHFLFWVKEKSWLPFGNSVKWTNCGNYERIIMVTAAPSSWLPFLFTGPYHSERHTFKAQIGISCAVWEAERLYMCAWVFLHSGEWDDARCLYNKRCCLHFAESLREPSSFCSELWGSWI